MVTATARTSVVDDLVIEHLPLIWWFARRHYAARAGRRAAFDLDDFAQEIALRALKEGHRYKPERCKFSTWVGWLAHWLATDIRQRVDVENNAKILGSTVPAVGGGQPSDRFATIADKNATDPAAGAALVRVLVPVEELTLGAVSLAWVRDVRANRRVQVPATDVVTYSGRLFAVAVSFDEGEGAEEGEQLHRVRFGNDAIAWVRAAVTGE